MQRKVFDRKVFNRKLVLITGGCAGIGRALAVRMAQAGARLVIFDLHQDALDGWCSIWPITTTPRRWGCAATSAMPRRCSAR